MLRPDHKKEEHGGGGGGGAVCLQSDRNRRCSPFTGTERHLHHVSMTTEPPTFKAIEAEQPPKRLALDESAVRPRDAK